MKKEVYGQVELDVSMVTEHANDLALLSANYDFYSFVDCLLSFVDKNGKLHKFKVHNWNGVLEKFFNEDE